MTPKVIASIAFAVLAIGVLVYSIRDKGPDLEKITPQTVMFECVNRKCKHTTELDSPALVALSQTEAKQAPDGSDWYYACPKCGLFTYHAFQPAHENTEQP